MKVVHTPEPGIYEVNWQWLPTFLGINRTLQAEIVETISPKLVGLPCDDATLQTAHDLVVELLQAKFPQVEGLREHLDGLKYVRYMSDGEVSNK